MCGGPHRAQSADGPRGAAGRNPKPRAAAGRAFTLIEVLVGAAIIAVLAAVTLPALARARGAARNTRCLLHLQQMSAGTQAHVSQYGYVPPASRAFDYPDAILYCPMDPTKPPGEWSYATVFNNALLAGEDVSRLQLWTAQLDNSPHRSWIYWDGWEERDKDIHNNYAYYDGHVTRGIPLYSRDRAGSP